MSEIDQSVIDGEHQIFSLRYVKMDGSIGEIKRARKNVKQIREASEKKTTRGFNHNIKESGTLLIYSEDKQGYRELKIDLLTHYNGTKIFHG